MTTPPDARVEFAMDRVAELLDMLERMAAGDTRLRLRISDRHDELDAVAHAINVLVGELGWATARALEAHEERAAAAERASASKSIFLRNMSHEIRTPITAVLGLGSLLASGDLAPEHRQALLHRLQANALAVLSLLDDLLDFSRLDAHRMVPDPESVSLIDLVHEAFAGVETESRAKGLGMRVEAAQETLGTIWTDRRRVRQILVNLVANAVKFTDAGSIVVALGAKGDAEAGQWTVDIGDTGIGIAADRQPYLFEPFEQLNPSIARAYGGSGLGLALSRRLAEELGGSLTLLHSAPGEGTTFRLILRPLPPAPDAESALTGAASDPVDDSVEGLHILLAEDHRDLHFALRQLLEQSGATVVSAFDGREAVAKATLAMFDVVLMDLRMPGIDGLEATRMLRSQGCTFPIVALTADPVTFHRDEALEAGCDACFSKPFDLEELRATIRRSSQPGTPAASPDGGE